MARMTRSLGALALLLVSLVGVPLALARLGGPLPDRFSWGSLPELLLRPDDGTVLLRLIAVVGWIAWAVFALSVLSELVAVLSRQRIRIRLPGLGGPQRVAAALILSVGALSAAPAIPHLAPPTSVARADTGSQSAPPTRPAAPDTGRGEPAERSPSASSASERQQDGSVTHVVEFGDDLWSLAERYYGDGQRWRTIAAANPQVLTGGPDRLSVGWRLRVPGASAGLESSHEVTVRRGDTLSSIADRELGSPARWPEIFRVNRALLSDPDELTPGLRLALPARAGAAEPEGAGEQDRSGADRRSESRTGPRPTRPGSAEAPAGKSQSQPGRSQPGDGGRGESRPGESDPSHSGEARSEGSESGQSQPGEAGPGEARPGESRTSAVEDSAPAPPFPQPQPATAGARPQAEPAATTLATPSAGATSADVPSPADRRDQGTEEPGHLTLPLAGVGGLMAAGLIAALGFRRRLQLQSRPVGRRILHPPSTTVPVEVALGRRQQPLTLKTLDLALRAIGIHCRAEESPLPAVQLVRVNENQIEIVLAEAQEGPPVPFRLHGRSWWLDCADAAYLSSVPGIDEALRPWPALATLGRDQQNRQVLLDLEALGLLQVEAAEPADAAAVLSALAVELSSCPWSEELALTLVEGAADLPLALAKPNVTSAPDVERLLTRLERRARAQRSQQPHEVLGQHRLDPELAEPWATEIVLVGGELSADQYRRLRDVVTGQPRVTVAAVVVGTRPEAPWTLQLPAADPGGRGVSLLQPLGLELSPPLLPPGEFDSVVQLVEATGRTETTPAPWWAPDPHQPDPPPDNVTYLGRRFGGWAPEITEVEGDEVAMSAAGSVGGLSAVDHPTLLLLGPVELVGATGTPPPRASKQCLEYCAWLLEHPGRTAPAMASALAVAEGTRRSNMSRLRTWLGESEDGEAYLPDAYTGRILLHPAVSSDWQRLQILTAPGVNRSSTGALRAALDLVRGAPLADAAPGQWHWAEELRTDMISCLRDVGVELSSRALASRDLDLARWAAARALVAAPGDELLLAARIRTEHLAGNPAETERLTLQLAAQARRLGVDLDPDTVTLLQEVMEGRVRARLA